MKGLFVTLEGIEGSGKSTQLERISNYLGETGREVVVTREPGGTPIAEAIREILLEPGNTAMAPTTELLLYAAARAQHVNELIRPRMGEGAVVICDRFADSTIAYQGGGRKVPREILRDLHEIATAGLEPDLTILIDLPVEEGLERAGNRSGKDRIEQESVMFHERVAAMFRRLAEEYPERIKVVDGTKSPDNVFEAIRPHIDALLNTT